MTELWVAFVTSGFAFLGILAGLIVPRLFKNSKELERHGEKLETVREQVQNSHGTNLRDDVDQIKEAVVQLRDGMILLRQDLSWARREGIDMGERITRLENGNGS